MNESTVIFIYFFLGQQILTFITNYDLKTLLNTKIGEVKKLILYDTRLENDNEELNDKYNELVDKYNNLLETYKEIDKYNNSLEKYKEMNENLNEKEF
jgi:hypothetical protein